MAASLAIHAAVTVGFLAWFGGFLPAGGGRRNPPTVELEAALVAPRAMLEERLPPSLAPEAAEPLLNPVSVDPVEENFPSWRWEERRRPWRTLFAEPREPAPAQSSEPASPPASALVAAASPLVFEPASELARESDPALPPSPEPLVEPTIHPPTCPAPEYPNSARRRGIEGVVQVRVEVSTDGSVKSAVLARGSGHEVLDEAALEAVRSWRFQPARRGAEAVEGTTVIAVRFQIER